MVEVNNGTLAGEICVNFDTMLKKSAVNLISVIAAYPLAAYVWENRTENDTISMKGKDGANQATGIKLAKRTVK